MLQRQFESQTLNINSCSTHQPKQYQSLDVNMNNTITISQHEHEHTHEHEQNSNAHLNKIKMQQQKQASSHSPHSLHQPHSHLPSPKKQKINQHYYIPKQIQIPTLYPKRILETIYRNGKGSKKNIFEKEISYRGSEGDTSLDKIGKQIKYGTDRNQSFNQYNSNSRDMRRNNNSLKNSKQLLPINPQSGNNNNFARTSIDYYTFQRSLSKNPQNPHPVSNQTSSIAPPPIKSNPNSNSNSNANKNTATTTTNTNNNKNVKSSLSQRPSSNYISTGQGKKMAILANKMGTGIGNGNVNNGSSPRNKYRELYQQYASNNNNVKGNLNQQKFRKTFSISRPTPSTGGQQSRIMQQIMQVYQTNPNPNSNSNPTNTIPNKNRNNSYNTPKTDSKIKQTPQTPKSTTKYYGQTYTAIPITIPATATQLPKQNNPNPIGFTFANRNSKSNLSHYQPSHPLITPVQGNQPVPVSSAYNPIHSPKFSKTSTNFHSNGGTTNGNGNSSSAVRPPTSYLTGTANKNGSGSGNGNIKQFNHNQAQDHSNYLAKYQIIKELGKGNYGIVYLARKKQAKDKSIKIQKDSQLQKQQQQNEQFLFAYGSKNQQIQRQSTVLAQPPSHSQPQNLQSPRSPRSPSCPSSPEPSLFAIKIYQKFKMSVSDPTKFKNIRKQINIMQNISHPNIIQLYQSVQTLTKINIVVEYGGALSLLEYLKENYPLSEARQRDIGRQVIRGLGYLHGRNIVHRDVKLQNLLVRTKGHTRREDEGKERSQGEDSITVKLIDFGFSTLSNFFVILAYKNRKLNAICGTPNYMAPQILAKKQYIGQSADIWSYGVVIYTIGQGRHPFKAQSLNQLERIVNKGVFEFKHITNPIQQNFIKRILKLKPHERPTAKDIFQHPWLALDQIELQKSSIN